MNLLTFLDQLQHKKIRMREQHLQNFYETVCLYGCDCRQTRQAIQKKLGKTFWERMTILLKQISFNFESLNLQKKAEQFIKEFIEKRYMRTIDLIILVNSLVEPRQQEVLRIKKGYNIEKYFPEAFAWLVCEINDLSKKTSGKLGYKRIWSIIQEIISTRGQQIQKKSQNWNSQIKTYQQLGQAAITNRIFIHIRAEEELFMASSNLGTNHQITRNLIESKTYPLHRQELYQTLKLVPVIEPIHDFKKCIEQIYVIMKKLFVQEKCEEMVRYMLNKEYSKLDYLLETQCDIDRDSKEFGLIDIACQKAIVHLEPNNNYFYIQNILSYFKTEDFKIFAKSLEDEKDSFYYKCSQNQGRVKIDNKMVHKSIQTSLILHFDQKLNINEKSNSINKSSSQVNGSSDNSNMTEYNPQIPKSQHQNEIVSISISPDLDHSLIPHQQHSCQSQNCFNFILKEKQEICQIDQPEINNAERLTRIQNNDQIDFKQQGIFIQENQRERIQIDTLIILVTYGHIDKLQLYNENSGKVQKNIKFKSEQLFSFNVVMAAVPIDSNKLQNYWICINSKKKYKLTLKIINGCALLFLNSKDRQISTSLLRLGIIQAVKFIAQTQYEKEETKIIKLQRQLNWLILLRDKYNPVSARNDEQFVFSTIKNTQKNKINSNISKLLIYFLYLLFGRDTLRLIQNRKLLILFKFSNIRERGIVQSIPESLEMHKMYLQVALELILHKQQRLSVQLQKELLTQIFALFQQQHKYQILYKITQKKPIILCNYEQFIILQQLKFNQFVSSLDYLKLRGSYLLSCINSIDQADQKLFNFLDQFMIIQSIKPITELRFNDAVRVQQIIQSIFIVRRSNQLRIKNSRMMQFYKKCKQLYVSCPQIGKAIINVLHPFIRLPKYICLQQKLQLLLIKPKTLFDDEQMARITSEQINKQIRLDKCFQVILELSDQTKYHSHPSNQIIDLFIKSKQYSQQIKVQLLLEGLLAQSEMSQIQITHFQLVNVFLNKIVEKLRVIQLQQPKQMIKNNFRQYLVAVFRAKRKELKQMILKAMLQQTIQQFHNQRQLIIIDTFLSLFQRQNSNGEYHSNKQIFIECYFGLRQKQ